MDISGLNLDVEEESKNVMDFSPLPDGEYQVVITDAAYAENKSGNGAHVSITMELIEADGDYEGRNLWANFNVNNPNQTAEKIGRAELASCCKAMGISNPQDTEDMKNIPFGVKVGLDKKDATKNRIKSYFALDNTPATAPLEKELAKKAPPVSKPAPTAKPVAGKKPWQR